MSAIPNLYLKWRVFRELADVNDPDNWIGSQIFNSPDGAQRFSKVLRGDTGCTPVIAQDLVKFMNEWVAVARDRAGPAEESVSPASLRLTPTDLTLPALSFASRLIEILQGAATPRLDRAHKALLRDMMLEPGMGGSGRLVVERYAAERSFASTQPSGGEGPIVFEAGKHKGQLAVLALTERPKATYTFFTRDPSVVGKHLWDLSWGEAMMWLPAPAAPTFSDGRLLLLPQAEPVRPTPGRFIVTCAMVWNGDAIERLDPRGADPRPGILDEEQTSRFLTNLRRMTEDKFKKWQGAVSLSRAEYIVKA